MNNAMRDAIEKVRTELIEAGLSPDLVMKITDRLALKYLHASSEVATMTREEILDALKKKMAKAQE